MNIEVIALVRTEEGKLHRFAAINRSKQVGNDGVVIASALQKPERPMTFRDPGTLAVASAGMMLPQTQDAALRQTRCAIRRFARSNRRSRGCARNWIVPSNGPLRCAPNWPRRGLQSAKRSSWSNTLALPPADCVSERIARDEVAGLQAEFDARRNGVSGVGGAGR